MITDDKHINHKQVLTALPISGYNSLIGKAIPSSLISNNLLSVDSALCGGLEHE